MGKPRALTQAEKYFIKEHREDSASVLSKDMDGIGEKTIQSYINSLPPEPMIPDAKPGQTPEERQAQLAPLGLRVGQLMGRDPDVPGVVVMTEGASELADANKSAVAAHAAKQAKSRNANRIHRPLGDNHSGSNTVRVNHGSQRPH